MQSLQSGHQKFPFLITRSDSEAGDRTCAPLAFANGFSESQNCKVNLFGTGSRIERKPPPATDSFGISILVLIQLKRSVVY